MALDAGTRAAGGDGIGKGGGFSLGKGVPMWLSEERNVKVNGGCSTKSYVRYPRCVGALCTETLMDKMPHCYTNMLFMTFFTEKCKPMTSNLGAPTKDLPVQFYTRGKKD